MKKTAHYRRAVWFCDSPTTLRKILSQCLKDVPDNEVPLFSLGDGYECVIARRAVSNNGVFLQFVVFENGAPAAVIPEITSAASLNAETADPPEGMEYIQSQLFCVVRKNDVVWTSHNTPLREGPINSLFHGLIDSLDSKDESTMFGLQAILDKNAFETAFAQGIGEIDLGLGDFKPVLEELLSPKGMPSLGVLSSLVKKEPTAKEIRAAADVMGRLVLKPGRRWDKPQVKKLLSRIASNVFENHEDEFAIVTKSGVRLTKKKMSVHTEYEVDGSKRILDPTAVRSKLTGILGDLESAGLLQD